MSQVKIQGNASGTGIFTVAAPNSNTDRTLTLPDTTGTVLNDQSDITAQVKTATNASGSAPIYSCRAWVNFNGTGTVAIRASGNVSSITDNGVGEYTVNFTNAMPDTNYAFSCLGRTPNATGVAGVYLQDANVKSTTQFRFGIAGIAGSNSSYDSADCSLTIFR